MVDRIEESAWQEIEIIGWLYQFYISEKKDEVIGKVVQSEDIPAATQLFTPNWIVKYMVQNSLGAQWLATYPDSKLKGQMEYYIEPAEQTDEVAAQLAAITPDTLNPEALNLIDPACGSGHILVEAYELFKAIYLERGYQKRSVAQLILEKNLFGLDIDRRAAQLTGFALMMKGRADDRRLFERGVKLNVMALVDSADFDPESLAPLLHPPSLPSHSHPPRHSREGGNPEGTVFKSDLDELKRLFEHATTFGSLIQVPKELAAKLPALRKLSEATGPDIFVSGALQRLRPLVQQAEMLSAKYDAVVANPPYMGSKFYSAALKEFVNGAYKAGNADLYGAFTLRNIILAKDDGHVGMITIPNWMFLSSFEALRDAIFRDAPISNLVHNGRGIWGSDFGSCSYILRRSVPHDLSGCFLRLFDKQGGVSSNEELERRFHVNPRFTTSNTEFKRVPGSPVAYWIKNAQPFNGPRIQDEFESGGRTKTHGNETYLRYWWEVPRESATWEPYANGGEFRKYSGNDLSVVNWSSTARAFYESHGGLTTRNIGGRRGLHGA